MVRLTTSLVVAAVSITSMVVAVPLPRPQEPAPADSEVESYGYSNEKPYQPEYGYGYEKPPMKEQKPKEEYYPPMKEEKPQEQKPPMHEPPKQEEKPQEQKPPMHEPPKQEEKPKEEKPPMHEPPKQEDKPKEQKPPQHEPPKQEDKPKEQQPPVKEEPKWGSGGEQWGNDYNSCVSKCMASYGTPPTAYTPPPSKEQPKEGKAGKVHTVLVAPVSGVFRYVPPMLDVPVGETVKFVWNGPNNHTVTKGSQLDMCNRTKDALFTSGVRNGSSEFFQTVNNTDPTYFFCTVGVHCAKGMFGIINPKKGEKGGATTVATMMPKWTEQFPDVAAAWSMIHAKTQNTPADTWGNDFDVTGVPPAQQKGLAENILYYRSFLAENPGVQELNAGAALPAGVTEFKLPKDISEALSATTPTPGGAGAAPGPAGSAPVNATPTGAPPDTSGLTASAGLSAKSSGLMVAVAAIAVTFFAL